MSFLPWPQPLCPQGPRSLGQSWRQPDLKGHRLHSAVVGLAWGRPLTPVLVSGGVLFPGPPRVGTWRLVLWSSLALVLGTPVYLHSWAPGRVGRPSGAHRSARGRGCARVGGGPHGLSRLLGPTDRAWQWLQRQQQWKLVWLCGRKASQPGAGMGSESGTGAGGARVRSCV